MKINELLNLRQMSLEHFTFYKNRFNLISYIRLLDFTCLLISLVLFFIHKESLFLFMTLFFSVIFIILICLHDKVDHKKKFYMNRMVIIDDYISRINGDWIYRLKETGNEFNKDNNRMLEDLNIIGDASLFAYLNVAVTYGGKRKLFQKLSNHYIDDESLKVNQEAILELSHKFYFCLDFQTKIKTINKNIKLENVSDSFQDIKVTYRHFSIGLISAIGFISLLILGLHGHINKSYTLIPVLFQITNLFIFHYTNKSLLSTIQKTLIACNTLCETFSILQNEEFHSSRLLNIKNSLSNSLIGLKKISNLVGWDTLRNNIFTLIIANFFFPFSILILILYDKNIKKYSKVIEESIESYEDFESLLSLSIMGQVKENVCIPKRISKIAIDFNNIQHPLLTEKSAVPNNFYTSQGVNIITGSNMSGKTLFMKTIGINLVLMNAGTFVNASDFTAAYFKIFTSMRITDDMTQGISTFYAELLRIKEAIDYQKENNNMLTLIDEVFKGTNSNDRIKGAISLINKLNTPKSIVVITTHDFELCDVKIPNLFNYNFSEYYEGNEIKFTYKINKGKCRTTNAKFLMKLVGIIS